MRTDKQKRIMMTLLWYKHFASHLYKINILFFLLFFPFWMKSSTFLFLLCKCNATSVSKNYTIHKQRMKKVLRYDFSNKKNSPSKKKLYMSLWCFYLQSGSLWLFWTSHCVILWRDYMLFKNFMNKKGLTVLRYFSWICNAPLHAFFASRLPVISFKICLQGDIYTT